LAFGAAGLDDVGKRNLVLVGNCEALLGRAKASKAGTPILALDHPAKAAV
jgi:hypothetical protein